VPLLVLGLGLGSPAYAAPPPVARYGMDEATWNGTPGEVTDTSGNGLHGSLAGGAPTPVPAKVRNGGSFNGSTDFIEVPYDPLLGSPDELTVTTWMNT